MIELLRRAREHVEWRLDQINLHYTHTRKRELAGPLIQLLADMDQALEKHTAPAYPCGECGSRPCEPREALCAFCLNWYTGRVCAVCREPQVTTCSGDVCINGHGGAPGVFPNEYAGP